MSEPLDLVAEAFSMKRLDRGDDPRVKLAAAIVQKPAVCHLVSERMLENVFEIGKQPCLMDELGRLQVVEPATQRFVR